MTVESGLAEMVEPPAPEQTGASWAARPSAYLLRFIGGRLLSLVGALVVLVIAVFSMVQIVPGDPAVRALGPGATAEEVENLRELAGWDDSFLEQFGAYLGGLTRGDLGRSFGENNEKVTDTIARTVGPTFELASASFLLTLVLGTGLGLLAGGLTQDGLHRRIDTMFGGVTSFLGALPEFFTGTVLVFFLAVKFRVFPVAGAGDWNMLVLPALAVSLHPTMVLARIARSETLNVLAQDYMRTARSQRLPWWIVYGRHVLPNVFGGALTVGGLAFASLIGGTVVVEAIFARPGLGTELVGAVLANQYAPIQGITLVLGATVIVMNTMIDVIRGAVDPRLRMAHV